MKTVILCSAERPSAAAPSETVHNGKLRQKGTHGRDGTHTGRCSIRIHKDRLSLGKSMESKAKSVPAS